MPVPYRKLQFTGIIKGRPVMRCFKTCLTIVFLSAFAVPVFSLPAPAQDGVGNAHLPIKNPASPEPEEAEQVYSALKERMAEGYALSKLEIVDNYQSWRRYNTVPYISATHGSRFVNSYANDKTENYGKLKEGETYAVGTVFAKDAITITEDDKQLPGALFVMEKLAAGTSEPTANWRYVVVNPDGSLFGDTTGEEADLVGYCHTCHEGVADQDYTFFVRKKYRVKQ